MLEYDVVEKTTNGYFDFLAAETYCKRLGSPTRTVNTRITTITYQVIDQEVQGN